MGNSVSTKDRHVDESVDFGALSPQGVYTGPQDWNQQVVGHLIVDRKLAPFYRPLEEYEEGWDDDQILAARKENPNAPPAPLPDPPASASSTSSKFHRNPNKSGKETFRPTEASVYRGAIECPICFLYYPSNINRSRCCDQAICTECFVQIKRAEPTTTHLVSEPAACPYCVQDNFGVIYEPPPWRTGLMSDSPIPPRPNMHTVNSGSSAESGGSGRRKSFGADSPDVVTIDQIRPDWEAKLAAVRAAVTRRANRRIIMRQVGDRFIPIGVTSGRAHGEGAMEGVSGTAEGPENGSGRRSRRRNHGGQDLNQLLGSVGLGGLGGQDLEELMVMEAMRLSLLEHEQEQRRQANGNEISGDAAQAASDGNGNDDTPTSSASPSPRPSSSPPTRPSVQPPHTPSPASSRSGTPPHRSPSRSRFPITPSPLSNAGNAIAMAVAIPGSAPSSRASFSPNAANASLQPPSRTHRRAGSSPGPPSSSTLSAALSAAQTATAFLNPMGARRFETEGQHIQGIPRSAPVTRAASPRPVSTELRGEGTRRVEEEHPSIAPLAFEPPTGPRASTSAHVLSPSPVPLVATPASELDENDMTRNIEGYKPLGSSMETGDPLLSWDNNLGSA